MLVLHFLLLSLSFSSNIYLRFYLVNWFSTLYDVVYVVIIVKYSVFVQKKGFIYLKKYVFHDLFIY